MSVNSTKPKTPLVIGAILMAIGGISMASSHLPNQGMAWFFGFILVDVALLFTFLAGIDFGQNNPAPAEESNSIS